MNHYVCAISCCEYVKIGITSNISTRLSVIKTSNPMEVRVCKLFQVRSRFVASEIEKRTHKILKRIGRHKNLEWFFDKDICITALSRVYNRLANDENLKSETERKLEKKKRKMLDEVKRKAETSSIRRDSFKAVVEYFGSQKELAKSIGFSTSAVRSWRYSGISATAALKVEEFTNGKFKASEMRPDVKQWRNK